MVNLSTNESESCNITHEMHQYLFSSTYILILLLGVPANLYSLYHAWQQMRAHNELGIYLLNLTASDLLYLASLPLWVQYFMQHDNWVYEEWLCKLCGFLLYENIYISVGFLCCISLDRFLAIVYPLHSSRFRTMTAATVASAFVWLKELGVGIFLFLQKEISKDPQNHSICFEHYPMRDWERHVNYFRFFVGFLLPFVILSVSYYWVLRVVRKSTGTQSSQKAHIKHLLMGTVVIFLVCFSPYHVFLLVRTVYEKDCYFVEIIFKYYHFSLLLTSLNCLADPVLYCFVSETTRRDIQRVLSACSVVRGCKSPAASSEHPGTKDSATSAAILLSPRE